MITEAKKQYNIEYRKEHPEVHKKANQKLTRKLKVEVLSHYGGVCICCGESEVEFLCIDHVNNDGNKHRKEIEMPIYRWLKKQGFPKDGFQILCFNCNHAKRFGVCPHQR